MLDSVYGIELASTRLVSLPTGTERGVAVDPDGFAARLSEVEDLYVDEEGVLRRR
jgi:hypothetical protein